VAGGFGFEDFFLHRNGKGGIAGPSNSDRDWCVNCMYNKQAQGEKEEDIFKICAFLIKIIDGKSVLCQYNIH
jgi:hypothetical protein